MAVLFLDTSALVKRYVREVGTNWIRRQTSRASGNAVHIVALTEVELTAAVSRMERGRLISSARKSAILGQLLRDIASEYTVLGITPPLLASASSIADRHALRAYDAVQLAAALAIATRFAAGPITVVSADVELNSAAVAEGLLVEDPNDHP